ERAIAQRLVRAKQRIRDRGIAFELPEREALASRLDSVLDALYLIFNEGYTAHAGEMLVRRDLCETALRLWQQGAAHPVTGLPKTHALLALMAFHTARLAARTGDRDRHGEGGRDGGRERKRERKCEPGSEPERATPAAEGDELFPLADQDRSRWDRAL